MAEAIKIVIGAEVNQAISNIGKLNTKLGDMDEMIAEVIGSSKDVDDALDKFAKQGILSINSLQLAINDFKTAFADATDPEDIKKYGEAIIALTKKQQDLVNSGLGVEKSHSSQVVATQRLSSSLLGLNKIFDILPAEVQHATHGFDQLIQSFERVTHGTEGAGEKVAKFAGVLGEVGLGIAISVVVGLLVEFTKELFSTQEALAEVTDEGLRFAEEIKHINKNIEDSKGNLDFLQKLADINIDINFDDKFEQQSLKTRERLGDLGIGVHDLGIELEKAKKKNDEFFKSFLEGASDDAINKVNSFPGLINTVPEGAFKDLEDLDKELIKNAQASQSQVDKINEEIVKNERETLILRAELRKTNAEQTKDETKKVNADLAERLNLIKEFTAKFATIKDPFPDFFTKNLPIGKVENRALRSALEASFKLLSTAARDLFNTQKIDPLTLPIDIHPKPEIVGKSAIVREIEDKFGEISKEVEDAVNKGIFEVPVDFRIAPDFTGIDLESFEKNLNDLIKALESSGQRDAIFDISPEFDVNKIDPSFVKNVQEKIRHELAVSADGIPLKFKIDAKGDVKVEVDKDKIAEDLAKDINNAIQSGLKEVFTGLGDLIGDAISRGFDSEGAKEILSAIAGIIGNVGKALIKAGVALLGLQKVIDKLATNPALAIGLGIALVALSRVFQNSISGAREKGGPVQAGFSYLVNEKGREIFVPNNGQSPEWIEGSAQLFKPKTSGKIIPAPLTASFAKMFADRFKMPKFESGGLVSGPVFGLLGEGAGISSINPEVIAPLETLKNLLPSFNGSSIDVRVTGSLSNRTIKLGQAREGRSNRRNT